MQYSILDTHKKLSRGETSSVALTQECLDRLGDDPHNSYITVCADRALQKAQESDDRRKKGESLSVLDGIPGSLKDLFVTQGIRTTAASKTLLNYVPTYDGQVSKLFEESGAVLIGKNNCDEFGMGSTGEHSCFGATSNPFAAELVAGGSSSGSASSVAEGSSLFSVGTDTGGSVRLPAHFCHLVGLKPTYGTISRYGQIAYASSLDQASPLTKTVSDAALILELFSARDSRDQTQAQTNWKDAADRVEQKAKGFLKEKSIAYCPEFLEGLAEPIKEAFEETLRVCKQQGARLVEEKLPTFKHCVSIYYLIATSEASANLARYDGVHFGVRPRVEGSLGGVEQLMKACRTFGFGNEVKKRIMLGTFSLSTGYQDDFFGQARKLRAQMGRELGELFSRANFLLLPPCATTAFEAGKKQSSLEMYLNDLFTIPANLTGVPAICLPTKREKSITQDNLPVGIQLFAPAFCDEDLLSAAKALENVFQGERGKQ